MHVGSLKRFCHPYYAVHILVILSYAAVRMLFLGEPLMMFVPDGLMGLTREQEIGVMGLMYLGARLRTAGTIDEMVGAAILIGKTVVFAWSWYMDTRVLLWYLVAYLVLFLVTKRPEHELDSAVTVLTPATFDSVVRQGQDGVAWLVFFYARWSDRCVNLQPVVSEVAARFSCRGLKFACIDLAQWPEVAAKTDISLSGSSWQLPTFILYEGGTEARRLPRLAATDGETDKVMIDRSGLVAYFELERRMLAARSGTSTGTSAGGPAQGTRSKKDK